VAGQVRAAARAAALLGRVGQRPPGERRRRLGARRRGGRRLGGDPAAACRRGYGEALTWRAARTQAGLPAILLASDDGRPVYQRMGFLPLLRFTVWLHPRTRGRGRLDGEMRRWPSNLAIVAAVLVAAVAVGLWAVRGAPRPPATGSPGAASPVVARIAVDDTPRQVVLAPDGLWVLGERALYRIDPASNRVVATIPIGTATAAPAALAMAGATAWVPAGTSTTLWRVDRAAERVAGSVRLDRTLLGPVGAAALDGTVWVSCCAFQHGPRPAGMLLRVDTSRNRVVARLPVADGPLAVTAGAGAVWVATARGGVLRVDPASNRVAGRVALAAGSRVEAITATPGAIWAVDTGDGNLLRLDPRSGRVGLAVPAPAPRGIGVGDAGTWAIVTTNRTLARVDERAGRLRARVPVGVVHDVRGIAVGQGALWVTTGNQVVRLDPRRLP
jgi:hypothetical protein